MCQLCLILTRGLCCLRRWNVCCWKKSEWNLSLPYSSLSYVLDCIVKWDSVHIFQLKHGIDLSIETILPRKYVHLKLTLDLPISGSIKEILITMENVPAFCFQIFLCLKTDCSAVLINAEKFNTLRLDNGCTVLWNREVCNFTLRIFIQFL